MFDSKVTPNQSWARIRNGCLCLSSQSFFPTALITAESFAFVIYGLFSTVSHIFLFHLSNMSDHVGNNQTHSHHSIIYVSWNEPAAAYHRAGCSENSYHSTSKATHNQKSTSTHAQRTHLWHCMSCKLPIISPSILTHLGLIWLLNTQRSQNRGYSSFQK